MRADSSATNVIRAVISIIRTRRAIRQVGVGARSRSTHIVRALVSVVRARRAIRFVIVQASARPIAGIRIGAIVVRRITAGRTCREVRIGAGTANAQIIRAFVAVIAVAVNGALSRCDRDRNRPVVLGSRESEGGCSACSDCRLANISCTPGTTMPWRSTAFVHGDRRVSGETGAVDRD